MDQTAIIEWLPQLKRIGVALVIGFVPAAPDPDRSPRIATKTVIVAGQKDYIRGANGRSKSAAIWGKPVVTPT
jgi:hypothetical protein